MDPINPWLDPVEVRRMAERLVRPATEPASLPADEAGFDSSFVGFASPALPRESTPSAVLSPENHNPPPVGIPLPETTASPDLPTTAPGSFLERIQNFRDWMHREFGASGIFILDRDGAVIFDESSHGRLHFLARSLAHASRRQPGSTANVHVKIGAHATLEVIPVETPYGCLVLGSVVPEPLPASSVRTVMQALGAAAAPAHQHR